MLKVRIAIGLEAGVSAARRCHDYYFSSCSTDVRVIARWFLKGSRKIVRSGSKAEGGWAVELGRARPRVSAIFSFCRFRKTEGQLKE